MSSYEVQGISDSDKHEVIQGVIDDLNKNKDAWKVCGNDYIESKDGQIWAWFFGTHYIILRQKDSDFASISFTPDSEEQRQDLVAAIDGILEEHGKAAGREAHAYLKNLLGISA